jgi:hypothetical protein
MAWMVHLAPFHRSARVTALEVKGLEAPTAVHADADVQDTPLKKPLPCGGLGVAWIIHLTPSHRSASVPPLKDPTAVQAEGEVHDTALRNAPPRGGLGVFWICQAAPFQRSTRAWVAPAMLLSPTAVQATGVLQATPSRAAKVDPGGFGVRTIRQERPFHRSARLAPRPEVLTCTPTAMHEFDPVHDAQNSCPVGISGLGVGVTDQPGAGAPAAAAFADAAAPTAGPSNTTAAPTAITARRIRPRIATPHFLRNACC